PAGAKRKQEKLSPLSAASAAEAVLSSMGTVRRREDSTNRRARAPRAAAAGRFGRRHTGSRPSACLAAAETRSAHPVSTASAAAAALLGLSAGARRLPEPMPA